MTTGQRFMMRNAVSFYMVQALRVMVAQGQAVGVVLYGYCRAYRRVPHSREYSNRSERMVSHDLVLGHVFSADSANKWRDSRRNDTETQQEFPPIASGSDHLSLRDFCGRALFVLQGVLFQEKVFGVHKHGTELFRHYCPGVVAQQQLILLGDLDNTFGYKHVFLLCLQEIHYACEAAHVLLQYGLDNRHVPVPEIALDLQPA
jgi:hypothetical protein